MSLPQLGAALVGLFAAAGGPQVVAVQPLQPGVYYTPQAEVPQVIYLQLIQQNPPQYNVGVARLTGQAVRFYRLPCGPPNFYLMQTTGNENHAQARFVRIISPSSFTSVELYHTFASAGQPPIREFSLDGEIKVREFPLRACDVLLNYWPSSGPQWQAAQ